MKRDSKFISFLIFGTLWTVASTSCPELCECHATHINCSSKLLLSVPSHLSASTTHLYLARNHLGPIINGSWAHMHNLTALDLSYNGIKQIIGCTFKGLFKLKVLNLKRNRIRLIQEDLFSDNSDLEVLDLSENKLETLQDPAFKYFRKLKELYLSDNYFTELKFGVRFQVLNSLQIFDLSYNNFGHVRSDSFEMIQPWSSAVRRTLNLGNCQIQSIQNGTLSTFNGLYELILTGNSDISLENLTATLKDLEHKNLKKLDISHMELDNVYNIFAHLEYMSLIFLNLSHNNINNIPNNSFDGVHNLKTLDLSFNLLDEISHEFSVLTNLNVLNISHNNISKLSGTIMSRLSLLTVLRASNNEMKSRADVDLLSLHNLEYLDFSHNQLDRIILPGHSLDMVELNFAVNKISDLDLLPLAPKLDKIDVSYNNLTAIGPFLFTLTKNIKEVNFQGNRIRDIDHQAFKRYTPEKIDLSGNLLTSIQYSSWSNVHHLNLSHNRITVVESQSFHAMSFIKVLDMANNSLKTLHSDTFKYLQNLTHLILKHNKLTMTNEDADLVTLFESLFSLKFLDVSNNLLTKFNSTALKACSNIEFVSMANNGFTYIIPDMFDNKKHLKRVELSNNPFHCGCELIPLVHWMNNNEQLIKKDNKNQSFICNSPRSRENKDIRKYSVSTFECDIRLLHLLIFGCVGLLLVFVCIVCGLVCHYYLKWRRYDLPDIKKAKLIKKDVNIDKVRVEKNANIEAYPDDLMKDIDEHIKMKKGPMQNGDVKQPLLENEKSPAHHVHHKSMDLGKYFYNPELYNEYLKSESHLNRTHPYETILEKRGYPFHYCVYNEPPNRQSNSEKLLPINGIKKKKVDKNKEKEKENGKAKKIKQTKDDKMTKKEHRGKHSKPRDKPHHHKQTPPYKYHTLDSYNPTSRWDSMGRDRWHRMQMALLNKQIIERQQANKWMTLPPPNKMAYYPKMAYPTNRSRNTSHVHQPVPVPRSQSHWELPNGRFERRATLPDPRYDPNLYQEFLRQREHRITPPYNNREWEHNLNTPSNPVAEKTILKKDYVPMELNHYAEVTFGPKQWPRHEKPSPKEVTFDSYSGRNTEGWHQADEKHTYMPRSRSEIVYSVPNVNSFSVSPQKQTENVLTASVSEYGIQRIPDKQELQKMQQNQDDNERVIVVRSPQVNGVRADDCTSSTNPSIVEHRAEIHSEDEIHCATPEPDYPTEPNISGWV